MGNSTYVAIADEVSLMAGNLDNLADNTTNVGGTTFDNTSNRRFYAVFALYLASVDLSAKTNPCVELFMVPSYDGTNYADTGTDASNSVYPPRQYQVCVLGVAETSAVHRAVSPHILLDPLKYTPVVINKTGAAFVTGNTLKMKTYTTTTA